MGGRGTRTRRDRHTVAAALTGLLYRAGTGCPPIGHRIRHRGTGFRNGQARKGRLHTRAGPASSSWSWSWSWSAALLASATVGLTGEDLFEQAGERPGHG